MKLLRLYISNIYNEIISRLNYFIKKFLLNISIKKGLNYSLVKENLKNVKDIYKMILKKIVLTFSNICVDARTVYDRNNF